MARKMRSIAVLTEPRRSPSTEDVITVTDPENNTFRFEFDPEARLCGLEAQGLTHKYLQALGLEDQVKGTRIEEEMVESPQGDIRKRMLSFDRLKVYLVRYYPKERDAIHRFFLDMERHYLNYIVQQDNMLNNLGYTVTSLMIEWGDYSLANLFRKYFSDEQILTEFMTNHHINGLNPDDVNSYHFFSRFFIELKEGLYLLQISTDQLRKALIDKLKIINPDVIQKRRIKQFVYDEHGKITHVLDTANKPIAAKHFLVQTDPLKFYKSHFPTFTDEIEKIQKYYPNLESEKRSNILYLALKQNPATLGIDQLQYRFKAKPDAGTSIVSLFHYSMADASACSAKNGMLCLEYVYSDDIPVDQNEILNQLYTHFPKLKKNITAIREGTPRPQTAMVSDEEVRKGLSINEQIEIETSMHLQVFDNLFLIGSWLRPESGLFGLLHNGIIMGDHIEERLYYGDDDDSFYYLTNDEIMMMIRHNYGRKTIGKTEIHVNFHIGKSNYFARMKNKNITIHRGEYANPDVTIYSTNDKLSHLLLKKMAFDDVLKSGGFKYTGKTDLLYRVVDVFNLDDPQEMKPRFQPKTGIRFLGVKFLFAQLIIFSAVSFLVNYVNMIWLAPFALGFATTLTILRGRMFREVAWFDVLWSAIYFVMVVLAISWPNFNMWHNDNLLLGVMGVVLLVSWLINRPVIYDYHKFDFRQDYADSSLFKVINNGLTFVWAMIFLAILVGTQISGDRYVSSWYNLIFLGFFLTYFYPVIYVRTNIKG